MGVGVVVQVEPVLVQYLKIVGEKGKKEGKVSVLKKESIVKQDKFVHSSDLGPTINKREEKRDSSVDGLGFHHRTVRGGNRA